MTRDWNPNCAAPVFGIEAGDSSETPSPMAPEHEPAFELDRVLASAVAPDTGSGLMPLDDF